MKLLLILTQKYFQKYTKAKRNLEEAKTLADKPVQYFIFQVMTADRREYSRKPGFPDMTVPPPAANFEDFQPEYGFNPEPEPFYGGYEPTQDMQWGRPLLKVNFPNCFL